MSFRIPSLALAILLTASLSTNPANASDTHYITGIGTAHGGVYSSQWEATNDLDAMAAWSGRRATFVGTFHDVIESVSPNWGGNTRWVLEQAWQSQGTPVANLHISATAFAIASGHHDTAITAWAQKVKEWTDLGGGRSLFIAPLQEHNGTWVPYGCDPGNFKLAYARVRTIARNVGLDETKARWVWAPNGWTSTSGACAGTKLADYYPGASIVDVIGYSAYRWSQESVYQVVGGVADDLRTIDASKPYLVLQTAAPPSASRDQWIRDMFAWARWDPNVMGVVWFNFDMSSDAVGGLVDWRVWASPNGPGIASGWRTGLLDNATHTWPLTSWFQPGALPFGPIPQDQLADRYAGSNRYSTAVSISKGTFAPGVPIAYVATGVAFPDALAAAAAGGHLGGPVLLVPTDGIHQETLAELTRLAPERIVVVGGTSAVSAQVESAVSAIAPTTRIGGTNRYDTAARIALDGFAGPVPVVYVATGLDFPDALAAAAAGGAEGGPVLLTHPSSLPAQTAAALSALQPVRIVIVGGTAAVSNSVADALAAYAPTERVAGANRYATAAALAAFNPNPHTVWIATGIAFPDALAGAAAAGSQGVPLLLTQPTSVPGPTQTAVATQSPDRVVVLGGVGVITDWVSWQLKLAAG